MDRGWGRPPTSCSRPVSASSSACSASIGVMGGLTTYSSFSYETIRLIENGSWLGAAANIVLTTGLCLVVCVLGLDRGHGRPHDVLVLLLRDDPPDREWIVAGGGRQHRAHDRSLPRRLRARPRSGSWAASRRTRPSPTRRSA